MNNSYANSYVAAVSSDVSRTRSDRPLCEGLHLVHGDQRQRLGFTRGSLPARSPEESSVKVPVFSLPGTRAVSGTDTVQGDLR